MPGVPNELEQRGRVPLGERLVGLLVRVIDELVRLFESLLLVDVRELTVDEGREPRLELLEALPTRS